MLAQNLIDSTITLGQLLMAAGFVAGGTLTVLGIIFNYVLKNKDASAKHDTRLEMLEKQCDDHDTAAKEFREHFNETMDATLKQVGELGNKLERLLGQIGPDKR